MPGIKGFTTTKGPCVYATACESGDQSAAITAVGFVSQKLARSITDLDQIFTLPSSAPIEIFNWYIYNWKKSRALPVIMLDPSLLIFETRISDLCASTDFSSRPIVLTIMIFPESAYIIRPLLFSSE